LRRIEQRNPALASLPDQALVIAIGIVSEKGKMKAVLTVRSSHGNFLVLQPRRVRMGTTSLAKSHERFSRGSTLIKAVTS